MRDPAVREAAGAAWWAAAARALGFDCDVIDSPIAGAEGNKEFLLYGYDPHGRHHRQA